MSMLVRYTRLGVVDSSVIRQPNITHAFGYRYRFESRASVCLRPSRRPLWTRLRRLVGWRVGACVRREAGIRQRHLEGVGQRSGLPRLNVIVQALIARSA